jgi:hypothetical protein
MYRELTGVPAIDQLPVCENRGCTNLGSIQFFGVVENKSSGIQDDSVHAMCPGCAVNTISDGRYATYKP